MDDKAWPLRVTLLLSKWKESGDETLAQCADEVGDALFADDILNPFVSVLDDAKRTDLQELRELVRIAETLDFGGYTQRDAESVANLLWASGYRRHPTS